MNHNVGGGTVFRIALALVPLFVVAAVSAPEWPARAAMLEDPMRTPVLRMATQWDDVVRTAWGQHTSAAPTPDHTDTIAVAVAQATNTAQEQVAPTNTVGVDARVAVVAPTRTPEITPTPVRALETNGPIVAQTSSVAANTPQSALQPLTYRLEQGNVLMLGDSLMGGIVPGMRSQLPRTVRITDHHRVSTGLTNQGYYDWPAQARAFAQEEDVQWVFVHLGGNDGQDMLVNGVWRRFGSQQWKDEYVARAQRMIDNIRAVRPQAVVVWIGLPAMRPGAYQNKTATIAALQEYAAQSRHVVYVDGHYALGAEYSKDGTCLNGRRCVLRANDGIHYTREGGVLLAHTALQQLQGQ